MKDIDKVRILANTCAVYIPIAGDDESMRILYTDDEENCFYAEGEESGNEYRIEYDEVKLSEAIFYSLVQTSVDELGNTVLVS